jgi:hypothetical protein
MAAPKLACHSKKCSFIKHKLRFFACFCLASAALKTFFNGLLTSASIRMDVDDIIALML